MKLNNRLVKLEHTMQPPPKPHSYLVEQDRDADHAEITALRFCGTIQECDALMERRPYDRFLVFHGVLED